MKVKCDILIIGAGIAGLWLLHSLKRKGYNALLITDKGIGAGQTLASQGIIHSGLKYTLAGKVNNLAKTISQMPNRWRDALNAQGDVDLSTATINSPSQYLMIPPGIAGNLIKIATQKTFGDSVQTSTSPYPAFKGHTLDMGEMVLDIPSIIRALAQPYRDCIKTAKLEEIEATTIIHTAAAGNQIIAKHNNHDKGLETQHRPLVMPLVKPAPFELYAHFVGKSDKPIATVTTHKTESGELVWYLGGQVGERLIDSNPQDAIDATLEAFKTYLPNLDTSQFKWSHVAINRVEGKSGTKGFMPDTPTIHQVDHTMYCWPTKLTFAPMLADMVLERLDCVPSEQGDFSALQNADYALAPWDDAEWTSL